MTSKLITRRTAIVSGLAALGGATLTRMWPKDLPPSYGNILRMGDNLTYAAHRAIIPRQSLAREYGAAEITSMPATGTLDPGKLEYPGLSETYRRLHHGHFAEWRLSVEGLVARPQSLSLADLKRLPARTQITRHTCEEGWTAIAQWTGVPLGRVLDAAGMLPRARYVVLYSYDDWVDCIDLIDALHPQTLVAYGMNGRDLPLAHGAPARLRLERQIGYKSMKYLQRLVVTDTFDDGGQKGSIRNGWSWYVGI